MSSSETMTVCLSHPCLAVLLLSSSSPSGVLKVAVCLLFSSNRKTRMHRALIGLNCDMENMQLCRSSYSKTATGWILKWLSNIIWGCQHSRLSSSSLKYESVHFLHRMWRSSVGLLTTKARGHLEQAAHAQTNTLTKHFPEDSTTQCYNTELPWKPDWVGPFGEWQQRFELTSVGHCWRCFIDWIICWVTQDTHTPLRWGNFSVRNPEEDQRGPDKIFYRSFHSLIVF